MIETSKEIYNEGKKSLDTLLREKAYLQVTEALGAKGINVNDVSDEDVEALVAAKTDDMMNGIKGFATGTAFALLISAVTGF